MAGVGGALMGLLFPCLCPWEVHTAIHTDHLPFLTSVSFSEAGRFQFSVAAPVLMVEKLTCVFILPPGLP